MTGQDLQTLANALALAAVTASLSKKQWSILTLQVTSHLATSSGFRDWVIFINQCNEAYRTATEEQSK
jgi:hypothetical protein